MRLGHFCHSAWIALFLSLFATQAQAGVDPLKLVESARAQVGVTVGYDGSYQRLVYPGGDVPLQTGVCTDVLIRALRAQGVDLQEEVHEDMRKHFSQYPAFWGLKKPDSNIDHRRVPNLMTFLTRKGYRRAISKKSEDYRAGDLVAWNLGGGVTHIGVLSDRSAGQGVPLVIHNIGGGAKEEDILFAFRIIGVYRMGVG